MIPADDDDLHRQPFEPCNSLFEFSETAEMRDIANDGENVGIRRLWSSSV